MYRIQILIICFFLWQCGDRTNGNGISDLNEIFSEIESFENDWNPFYQVFNDEHPDSLRINTWEQIKEKEEILNNFLIQLDKHADASLDRQDQISKSVMRLKLRNEISGIEFGRVLIPFNAEGGFYTDILFALSKLPFNSYEDYKAYLAWLPDYAKYLNANQSLMERGISEGIVAPKVIVNNMITMLKQYTSSAFTENPLAAPFHQLPSSIPADQKEELFDLADDIFTNHIIKAYKELLVFIESTYYPSAKSEVGISHVANGRKLYEDRVNYYSTLNMSPDSVYRLGLNEVSRIRDLMNGIIEQIKFQGSYAEFLHYLRTDSQFYPQSAQELLNYAAWLSKKAEGQLPRFFSNLYSLPFTVEAVPDEIAPTYTAGRYVNGNANLDEAGIYWVNTYKLESRTLYTLPALTLHEAVPGHHLQLMIAAELEDIPDFRNSYYISAYGEGWALYGEYLGEEMGMYETPYNLFGRYTYEMWRACRLVVDVGLHYKNWTRQEALDYMTENTALSMHEITTEIDRYIGWPGQALSYKIGEITIKNLRVKAEKTLEDKFSIKDFHEVILRNGSIPLTELIKEVDRWIDEIK